MAEPLPTIAILGASGLIGEAIARQLTRNGFPIRAVARRFTPAQRAAFGAAAIICPFVTDVEALRQLLTANNIDIVVNCVGVLQDSPHASTDAAHRQFVERLLKLLESRPAPALLVHLSIPGNSSDDRTSFSRSKRAAERAIASSPCPSVILRPGFVVAPAAYGGGAVMRALATSRFELPEREACQAFATTDVADIGNSIAILARDWQRGSRTHGVVWDVMARGPTTVGDVITALRDHYGGPRRRFRLPAWSLTLGAIAGDFAARLGWSPPLRTTALQEMRRGISGDPGPWMAATGITPAPLAAALERLPATAQEHWFARLFLLKPLILASLAVFWVASGLIALTVAFGPARAILIAHGFPFGLATAITIIGSGLDITIGLAIAVRRTARVGLAAGIATSLFYMAGAAVRAPELWLEPLGALVKTLPAIVLMLVALATLDNR